MLEDVTREIEEESNYLDYIPRRNDKLEPLDLEVLGFSNFISMSEDQYSALAKGISYNSIIWTFISGVICHYSLEYRLNDSVQYHNLWSISYTVFITYQSTQYC